jgi:hypothetical protein
MGGKISGWFVVCMGDKVENRLVTTQDKTNGQWELWNSMRFNELRDMRCLVPMRRQRGLLRAPSPLSKHYLLL